MKLKPYPKYKDSRVQWIGKIPEEWEVRRFPSFGFFSSSGINKKTESSEPLVKMVNYTDIYGNDSLVIDSKRELMTVSCPKGKIIFCDLKKGDIVFTPSSETEVDIGLSAVILENLKFTVFSYHVIRFRTIIKINLHFKKYIGNNHFVLSQFSSICKGTTRQILTHNDFKSILTILPPFQDQTVIANFLDKKTTEIDELIKKNKRLIELLKEKRAALINHVVTKGLDPNVKLKDSGIELIGEIPEDWEILRLRYLLKNGIEGIKIGPFGSMLKSDEITNNGYKVYGQENVINRNFNKGSRYINEDKFKQLIGYQIHPGDLIITMMGTIGKAQIIPTIIDEGIMDSHLIRLRFNGKVETKFIEILINSSNYIKGEIKYFSKGSIMEGLNSGIIKDLLLCIPQKIEQTKIIQFVNRKVTKMDKTIQKIEEKIKFLEEYKKSLIHHAVTGKIDIREVKI